MRDLQSKKWGNYQRKMRKKLIMMMIMIVITTMMILNVMATMIMMFS